MFRKKNQRWFEYMKQNYLYYLLVGVLLAGFYTTFTFQQSYAQVSTPSSPPTDAPIDDTNALPFQEPPPSPMPADGPINNDADILSLTLAELGYEDVTLNGPGGQVDFDVDLPTHWEILPDSSLLLHYVANIGLKEANEIAELQVILNGVSIYQTNLTNSGRHNLVIPLPDIWPERTKGHRLTVSVRIKGDCEQTLFNSITILAESLLTLVYQPVPLLFDLSLYPSPLYEKTFFPSTSHMVLPSQPTDLQVDAGLSLAAGLGYLTNNELIITATTDLAWDQTDSLNQHLIVLGTPDSNTLLHRLNNSTELPAFLHPRRLQLMTFGPDIIVPGTQLTYTLHITNNETISATALHLNSQLLPALEKISCQPRCQIKNSQASWNINALPPGITATYTLTFRLPLTPTLDAIDLVSELAQNQAVINVSTLHNPVELGVTPSLTHTTQLGEFFFVLDGRAIPEFDGIIQLFPSPWQPDRAILLVTGLTDEAVFKAGRALGTEAYFPGMKGQVALVQEIFEQRYTPPELTRHFTLADLGYEDQVVSGIGQQDILYRFQLPQNWLLTPEANVSFLFSHSPLLDPTHSSLTLLFNKNPFASVALDESNSMAGELNALLPPQRARIGRNSLVARVETRLPDPCADVDSSRAWINLNASSALHLPHVLNDVTTDRFDLDFLPSPFTINPNLADVMLVLPEQPSAVEYTAAIQVFSQLGAASSGGSFRPTTLLGAPTDVDLSTYQLIVIGRPSRNPLLQIINEALPQPFLPQTDIIRQQVDEIVFRLPDNLDLGYLQLIPSNWSSEHALLVVTGASDLGVSRAAQALADPNQLWKLKGDLALLRDDQIFTIDTRKLTSGGEIATITTAISEATIVGTATPTRRPPTPMPVTQTLNNPGNISPSNGQNLPTWVLFVIGGGIGLIFVVLGLAYRQSRHQKQQGV